MKTRQILPLLAAAMLFTAASCGGGKTDDPAVQLAELKKNRADLDKQIAALEAKMPDTGRKATPVTVLQLANGEFSSAIEVQATIEGEQNVVASPQAPGRVTSILVRPGQRVGRGQTLATLDANVVSQQANALDPQIALAKSLYEKQKALRAQDIGTEVQLLQAKAQYEGLLKQKAAVGAQRDLYRIVAPISGTVDEVDLVVGDIAQPGGMMNGIRIVNLSALKAVANLGESYLGKVKVGDPVTLIFPELGESLRAKLGYVGQSVTPSGRSFRVEVPLGTNNQLRPNMSCQMKIANYRSSGALSVPVQVIQKTPQGDFLFVAENGKAKTVNVKTGRVYNGQVEILAGLSPGDKVIVEGYQELDNGKPVTF